MSDISMISKNIYLKVFQNALCLCYESIIKINSSYVSDVYTLYVYEPSAKICICINEIRS